MHSIQAGGIDLELYQAQHPSADDWRRVRVRIGGLALGAKHETSVNIHHHQVSSVLVPKVAIRAL